MKALDAIRIVLKFSDMGMKHLGEMSDAPLLRPGPWGGNHAMWIAGHLTVVEGRLQQMLHGTPNPVHHWKPLFDWGSEPTDDPADYPPFDEVLQKFNELRQQTHAFLDEQRIETRPLWQPLHQSEAHRGAQAYHCLIADRIQEQRSNRKHESQSRGRCRSNTDSDAA